MNPASTYTAAMRSFLESKERDMFSLLEDLVLIQSGSHNKKGVDAAARRIATVFQEMGLDAETKVQPVLGNHLLVRTPGHAFDRAQILMVGHMDTVFPADTDFNWYREEETRICGPGVVDMKGGLVVGIFALKALQHAGLLDELPITFLFNSDEEIGSRSSLRLIQNEANRSAFALVLECGGLNGEVVTGRKGNLMVELHVEGQAGHAAFAEGDKASAILEMAHKTIQFESLNDFERGITVNVGKVEGGIGPNTVSDLCTAQIDLRYRDPADLSFLENEINAITGASVVNGTASEIQFISGRPPMQQSPANKALFHLAQRTALSLGMGVKEEFRYGGSDANFIADLGIPVLDGLGPVGAKDHSDKEFMLKESLLQRAILVACTLAACWEAHKAS